MTNIDTNHINKGKENKEFIKMLFSICIPITAQYFVNALVNLIDSVMVGKLGDIAVASVGLSNQVFFIFNLLMLGVASGVAIFMTQYWGKKDMDGLHKSIAFGLIIIIPTIGIGAAVAHFMPAQILSVFTPDVNVIFEGSKYLKIVSLSYLPIAISIFLGYALRSTDMVKYSVYVVFGALFINVILNYFLIFGIWIFPQLGIVGAAIATNIARYTQVIVLIIIIYSKKMPIAIKSFSAFKINSTFFSKFAKTSGIVFLNEALFGVGAALLFSVYGRIGTDVVAGADIAKTVENLVWIFFWSLCAAASVSVGKLIGAKEYDKAKRYAYKFIATGVIAASFLGILLIILKAPILSLFDISSQAKGWTNIYLILFSIFILIRGPIKILTGGVLRAGGDTTFVMMWDVIPLWITLFVCYVYINIFEPNVFVIFLLVIGYELVKVVPTLRRIKSGKWMNYLAD